MLQSEVRFDKLICDTEEGEEELTLALASAEESSRAELFLGGLLPKLKTLQGNVLVRGNGAEWFAFVAAKLIAHRANVQCVVTSDALHQISALNNAIATVEILREMELIDWCRKNGNINFVLVVDGTQSLPAPDVVAHVLDPRGSVWLAMADAEQMSPPPILTLDYGNLGFYWIAGENSVEMRHCHPQLMREFVTNFSALPWSARRKEVSLFPSGNEISRCASRLKRERRLRVRGPSWHGIPQYCRFVYSGTDLVFEQTLSALSQESLPTL